MKDPLGVSPSKGNQGTTRGKEKILLTSVGIEPTTEKVGDDYGGESRRREIKGTYLFTTIIVPDFLCPTS